jgi:hypothetical protein
MSLPEHAEKEYLAISPAEGEGFLILARKQHADELAALFAQRGQSCRRQPGARPGHDALLFGPGADRAAAEEVLNGYKRARGS